MNSSSPSPGALHFPSRAKVVEQPRIAVPAVFREDSRMKPHRRMLGGLKGEFLWYFEVLQQRRYVAYEVQDTVKGVVSR